MARDNSFCYGICLQIDQVRAAGELGDMKAIGLMGRSILRVSWFCLDDGVNYLAMINAKLVVVR